MKSRTNVAGLSDTGGTGGWPLSGDTQAVRSKSMNSSAASCAERVPCLHDWGNIVEGVQVPMEPEQVAVVEEQSAEE